MRIGMGAIHLGRVGDFVAVRKGGFSVPQNPVDVGLGDFVAVRKGGFSVPQNPVDVSVSGLGCGCGGGCDKGMGTLSTDLSSTWTALGTHTIGGFNAGYVLVGLFAAAVVLPMWMSGRKR